MIRLIEELSMSAWPSLQTHLYDGWVLRVSNGYTKRANSVNPIYKSDLEIDEKIEYCKKFYENLGLPTVYKITSDINVIKLDTKLNCLGYSKIDETSVQVLDLEQMSFNNNSNIEVSYGFTQEWADGYCRNAKIEKEYIKKTLASMLSNIIGKTIFVKYSVEGQAIGFGYGVVDNGYVGIFDIYINEIYRGKGYGRAVMNKILLEAKKIGANKAYLQVVVGNTAAENLYHELGFKEIYRYWYRKL